MNTTNLVEILRDSPMNLARAAELLGVSSRTLVRVVRKTTGMTFLQLKDSVRLETAKRRLSEGRPILEVALGLGFSSTQAFTTWFRKRSSVSPARWRNRNAVSSLASAESNDAQPAAAELPVLKAG